jgi:hypothetical protein
VITTSLRALVGAYADTSFCLAAKASAYGYAPPLKIPFSRFAPWIGILVNRIYLLRNTGVIIAILALKRNQNMLSVNIIVILDSPMGVFQNPCPRFPVWIPKQVRDDNRFGAGGGSRTPVLALGRLHNSRYTTPAETVLII